MKESDQLPVLSDEELEAQLEKEWPRLMRRNWFEKFISWGEKRGWFYATPTSLTMDDWDNWEMSMQAEYPVQYRIRTGIDSIGYLFSRNWSIFTYFVRKIFKPAHNDIRKAIPRGWQDISSLLVDVNFAMIKSFKKEADESFVDWDGTPEHRKFKNWLDTANDWVCNVRPSLQKQMDAAYPDCSIPGIRNKSYEELYGEVNRLEKLIDDTDTNILKQFVEYRHYAWT